MTVPENKTQLVLEVTEEDAGVLPRRRRREDADMDITPMIDITFLLLIFFLVASRMNADAPIELPPARYGTAVSAKNSVVLTVGRGSDGGALIYKGDGKVADTLVASSDPLDQEEEVRQFVENQLGPEVAKEHVLIKAERGVKHREVARVAKAVGKAAESQLYVAVLEIE